MTTLVVRFATSPIFSNQPSKLKLLRPKHDAIITAHVDAAFSIVAQDPYFVNKVSSTLAVIKETFCLFSPSSSTHARESEYSIVSEDGKAYPTDDYLV